LTKFIVTLEIQNSSLTFEEVYEITKQMVLNRQGFIYFPALKDKHVSPFDKITKIEEIEEEE